jgi:cell fate (sporulation/competence/biofilm development) regulator YmcA (YheA/YmcA/DUF963 family)
MPDFSERYRQLLESRDVPAAAARTAETRERLWDVRAKLREAEGKVPFWDQLIFYQQSDKQKRVDNLSSRVDELRSEFDERRQTFESRWSDIESDLYPLTLARRIDDVIDLATERLQVEGLFFEEVGGLDEIRQELRGLAQEIVDTYVSDFDPDELFEALESPGRCRTLAGDAETQFESDPEIGYRPIGHVELKRAMAARLLEVSYFEARDRVEKLRQQVDELERMCDEADESVGITDRMNLFSESDDQLNLEKVEHKLDRARQRWRKASETLRHELRESVAMFPPMHIYIEARGALGVLEALEPHETTRMEPDGTIADVEIIEPRSLLLAGLEDLRGAFHQAFPGLETPGELEERVADVDDRADRRAKIRLERNFFDELDERGGRAEQREALVNSTMLAALRRQRRTLADGIGVLDRLAFWSDTEAEQREEAFEEREKWHARQLEREWKQLKRAAREAGEAEPQLCLRDGARDALEALHEVRTDSGERSRRRDCSVYGRDKVYKALDGIERVLRAEYGLRDNRHEMMRAVANRLRAYQSGDTPEPATPDRTGPFEPLEFDQIVDGVAAQLVGTDFPSHFEHIDELNRREGEVERKMQDADAAISFWDKVNIFSKTEAQEAHEQLENRMQTVEEELDTDARAVNRRFEQALGFYPPARLYLSIDGIRDATAAIRAVCHSRTRTTGSGEDEETETVYYCSLHGENEAIDAMQEWNAEFVEVFGDLPNYQELLTRWATRDAPNAVTDNE